MTHTNTNSFTLYNGHMVGSYMSNDASDYAYLPLPKNASSYLKGFFRWGWDWEYKYNYFENSNKKFIVCLRDPIDRWFTGVVQYFNRQHPNMIIQGNTFLDFICERIHFDEHTLPQVNLLDQLNLNKMIFFKFNDNISDNIDKFVTEHFNDETWSTRKLSLDIDKNESSNMYIKQQNLSLLKNHIKNNPKYLIDIEEFYKEDYNLMNSVTYYGK